MWLAENWDATVHRVHTTESHPKRIREAYREWLAEEWNSVFRIPENRAYTNPGDIRQAYREWLAEEWNSVIQPLENSETHHILLDNCCPVARLTLLESDKLFGEWVKENGFGDISSEVRSNAMWLAENWESVLQRKQNTESHPTRIRQAYNEWLKSQEDSKASPDLPKASPACLQSKPCLPTKQALLAYKASPACLQSRRH